MVEDKVEGVSVAGVAESSRHPDIGSAKAFFVPAGKRLDEIGRGKDRGKVAVRNFLVPGVEYRVRVCHYYKKTFFVPAGKRFLVPVPENDTISGIQKISHFWCRLLWTNTKKFHL
jgi:hypothetical protein